MDKRTLMWIIFIGCVRLNLKNSLKHFAIIVALMDNFNQGTGYLIGPMKTDKNHTSKMFEDEKLTTNQSTSLDFNSNSINDEYLMEPNINKTFFRSPNNSIIVSQVGSIVQIPCRVHLIGDEMVSWIRRKDFHLLTVGLTTYSSDERFSMIHFEETEDWQLQIKFVQLRDAGFYECAVSSHPSISMFVQLDVSVSRAEISGPSEKYLKPGSTLKLTCRVYENIDPPLFLFWYHNTRMINYDSHLGINVTIDLDNKYSELLIVQTGVTHSGNYTCLPSNAAPASTFVHIFNGENPYGLAAYGRAGKSLFNFNNQSIYFQTLLLVLIITYRFVFHYHSTT